jgi:predicted nucleic acid-binding protein
MSAEVLIDTNVLVYAFDLDAGAKGDQALELLSLVRSRRVGAVTAQVLAEFFVTVRRRFPETMDMGTASAQVQRYADTFEVFDTNLSVVLEALRGVTAYRMSYYDAQIWACARLNHVPVVLSEDFQDGAVIEGVRFVNPFALGFDLAALFG